MNVSVRRVGIILLICGIGAYVAMMSYSMKPIDPQTYEVAHLASRSISAPFALSLGYMTRVQSEGEVVVGILKQFYTEDLRDMFPEIRDYDIDRDAILWSYGLKPVSIQFPDGVVKGKGSSSALLWYCKIPLKHVHRLQHLVVSTEW